MYSYIVNKTTENKTKLPVVFYTWTNIARRRTDIRETAFYFFFLKLKLTDVNEK